MPIRPTMGVRPTCRSVKNLPIVVVARRARLRVHVRHVVRGVVPLVGALARIALAGHFAAQLAGLRLGIVRQRDALAGLQAVGEADRAGALAHVADELLVADGLVGLVDRGRTVGRAAVAVARVTAAVVIPAPVAELQGALGGAARPLRGTTLGARPQFARLVVLRRVRRHRVAARILAVLLPAAVALLARVHDAVAANRCLRLCGAKRNLDN